MNSNLPKREVFDEEVMLMRTIEKEQAQGEVAEAQEGKTGQAAQDDEVRAYSDRHGVNLNTARHIVCGPTATGGVFYKSIYRC